MDNGASGDASFRSAVVTNNGQSIVAPFRGATSPGADADTFKRYDAFLSYSWKADAEFARILQHALHRFAKPWWQLRAVRLFRDKENEDVGRGLTSTLQHALAASEYLILLASPAAARSHWVGEEIAYWRQHRAIDKLLIVVTSGTVRWDAARGDFDWEATTALPASLFGAFAEEPL